MTRQVRRRAAAFGRCGGMALCIAASGPRGRTLQAGRGNDESPGGAWIPARVPGTPGDPIAAIAAIAIGVPCMKNMNPGPMRFVDNTQDSHAVFTVVILAQPLLPLTRRFRIVGSFAINDTVFGVIIMLPAGLLASGIERWGLPVAPTILGGVPGTGLEEHCFSSLVKADGQVLPAFVRAIDRGGPH